MTNKFEYFITYDVTRDFSEVSANMQNALNELADAEMDLAQAKKKVNEAEANVATKKQKVENARAKLNAEVDRRLKPRPNAYIPKEIEISSTLDILDKYLRCEICGSILHKTSFCDR